MRQSLQLCVTYYVWPCNSINGAYSRDNCFVECEKVRGNYTATERNQKFLGKRRRNRNVKISWSISVTVENRWEKSFGTPFERGRKSLFATRDSSDFIFTNCLWFIGKVNYVQTWIRDIKRAKFACRTVNFPSVFFLNKELRIISCN